MELKMNWPGCIQSQLKISTNLSFLSKFDETYFFALLPAPASRKPFANGLLSIFSCVICKVFVILKLGDQQLDLKIICFFQLKYFIINKLWEPVKYYLADFSVKGVLPFPFNRT